MTDLDEYGRPEPPVNGDELASMLGFLDYQRATFAWKCRGLDAEGFNTKVAASSMTLGGMMKHLALVEEGWFSETLHGRERGAPWSEVDWKADRDWEWHTAPDDSPEELLAQWERSLEIARAGVAEALEGGGLDQLAERKWSDGRAPSLRWIILHMIEEYARHNGHADLIREAVDGETGE
ncbi:DinB family protein [Glycomyces buryatensis]|uniref:DinB family protein n=2 Tax=Glycomyces buryatensis TaxID=2570927 RepID=A0A4V4HSP4_9ACTN|nr:DinB family protein [Glycomyces buryatensis]